MGRSDLLDMACSVEGDDLPRLSVHEKMVLICIAMHADSHSEAMLPVDWMTSFCCSSRSTIQRATRRLVSLGIIEKRAEAGEAGVQLPNVYRITDRLPAVFASRKPLLLEG